MGLRCLLGHEYANREVEREREERGDEVVVTYRTVETCERCGERRIVSENKEVRPIREPGNEAVATGLGGHGGVTPDPDAAPEGEATDAPAEPPEPTAATSAETPDVDVDTGAETVDAAETPAESAEADADADVDVDVDGPTPEEEDAIILDDDEESEDRGHGEWPEADGSSASGETEPAPEPETETETDLDDGATVVSGGEGWPEPEGEDEGFDAEPSDGGPPAASFGGGLTPEGEVEVEVETEADAGPGTGTGTGTDAAGEAAAVTNGAAGSVAGKQFVAAEEVEPVGDDRHDGETEFFCPNCGYARPTGSSSMRAGDICPDCHEGYIGERER